MKRMRVFLLLLALASSFGCALQAKQDITPFIATPVKLENKWDYYRNGYPPGYEKPSHVLEILTTPFPIPYEVRDNFLTTPWIITHGEWSDSTIIPAAYSLNSYNIEPYYIQVGVELSYGTEYHKIPALASPVYADCMLLYAYSNDELNKEACQIVLADQVYSPADLRDYIIFFDDEIIVYNILSLVAETAFEEQVKAYNNSTNEYGYAKNSEDYIMEIRQYLIDNVPKMIRKNNR